MAGLLNLPLRAAALGATMALLSTAVHAEEADKFSGAMGASYNTHFVSYGFDVWGGGDEFFKDRSTTFVWGDYNIDLSPITLNFGFWADVNNNTAQSIGGNIQEIDVYAGLGYTIGPVFLGATFQAWNYASDTEEILDLKVALDDTGMMFEDFGFKPALVYHMRVKGNGAQEVGSALVFSIAPGITLIPDDTYPVSLTVPAGVGFFMTDDFQGGVDGGYGYAYGGVSLGVPLAFIPASYGAWSFNFDAIYYTTEPDAIPGNPEDGFLTGSFGLKVAF